MTSDHLFINGDGTKVPLAPTEKLPSHCEVCVVGAGPAGLMLAANLARFGIKPVILDERPDQTSVGRADGLQPKTIETLHMMRLGDDLVRFGVKVFDICIWRGTSSSSSTSHADEKVEGGVTLRRMGREVHYPASVVDLVEPYILLCHQGMVEGIFVDDLRKRGVNVTRNTRFDTYSSDQGDNLHSSMRVHCKRSDTGASVGGLTADYIVGCDGAHSRVRQTIPGAAAEATSNESHWGVLDGVVVTDFPDIWSKTVVFNEQFGSILLIPRERNMTRFYVEIKEPSAVTDKKLEQEFVIQRANDILRPYSIRWTSIEWFGRYRVAQRVAPAFADPPQRVFIAGDASHSHSPKAAQGMNTSVHDTWNLAWKLNLAVRGLAKPALLATYEEERKKIAHDLINFDYEHANQIAGGDSKALAENFRTNVRFISGAGVDYAPNVVNCSRAAGAQQGGAVPGCNLPPAKLTRYIDANPVSAQLDIPMLGQFRVFIFVPDIVGADETAFLRMLSSTVMEPASLVSRLSEAARRSYAEKPRLLAPEDAFYCPERYTGISDLVTFALITMSDKNLFEISQLPPLLSKSPWTVYLDDAAEFDTRGMGCTDKWLGGLRSGEVGVMIVRPDGMPAKISVSPGFTPLANTKLFTPFQLGRVALAHRIVSAPCTRMRGEKEARGVYIPVDRHVTYYSQRATDGGLLLTEATDICLNASGYVGVPGVFTDSQLAGWKRVTDAVHAKGGYIFVQLWHTGRASSPALRGGVQPISSSTKPMSGKYADGLDCAENPPRAMTVEEIHSLTEEWAAAAKRAVDIARFDGVEIHGANGYLLEQFLHDNINDRTDEYGGSVENRSRFTLEVVKAVAKAIGSDRTGIRLSPYNYFQDTKDSNPVAHWLYLCDTLAGLPSDSRPAYVHMVEPRFDEVLTEEQKLEALVKTSNVPEELKKQTNSLTPFRRSLEKGGIHFLACGNFNRDNASAKVENGLSDAVVFGRWYIANPDLVERLRNGWPLNQYDRSTFYGAEPPEKGYIDYPFFEDEAAETNGTKNTLETNGSIVNGSG
ncbi:FAD binding domain-containing protein [Niveomyces insectorum RCEF 264]|uniref:FAD binding domain-containing protein n=1 Tax=Niveomyces insectorum RCEF 264 TaxID=1081102 RepID=A0A167T6K6_9HYPO|nr:FAD binding domain-containing protein [Niveomyces insectorum RCEF 264]